VVVTLILLCKDMHVRIHSFPWPIGSQAVGFVPTQSVPLFTGDNKSYSIKRMEVATASLVKHSCGNRVQSTVYLIWDPCDNDRKLQMRYWPLTAQLMVAAAPLHSRCQQEIHDLA
jgi:hypothetical protein